MDLAGLLADVMERRPRRYVERLQCADGCGRCWYCTDGQRGRYVVGTGRFTDLSHGTKTATVITTAEPYPFREEELAGPYLRTCHARGASRPGMAKKRVPWTKAALRHLDLLPPRFFAGLTVGSFAYVDVTQAYPSIYRTLTLDMKWTPHPDRPTLGFGQMSLAAPPEVMGAKWLHRAVGGIIRSTSVREVVNGRPRQVPTIAWSRFLAPDLWGIIQWTLHAVARMAIDEFGAVLWDTDGGVVPRERAAPLMAAISDRWGMRSKIEHEGEGTIYGVKHWRIGADETAQASPKRPLDPEDRVLRPSPAIVSRLATLAEGRR